MSQSDIERFWSRVNKTESCWEWTAGRFRPTYGPGYGAFVCTGKTWRAHRWAWQTFVGPIPAGLSVLHHCDNPICVRPDHLFLGDHKANMADRDAKGRQVRGDRASFRKVSAEQVNEIRRLCRAGELTQQQIGDRFGIDQTTVSLAATGKNWPDATEPSLSPRTYLTPGGRGKSKLNAEKVAAIRMALSLGTTRRELASQYGVSRSTVALIARNRLWQQ